MLLFFFQDTLCKTSLAKKKKAWTIIRTDGTNISQYCIINWMMNEEDEVFDYTTWKIANFFLDPTPFYYVNKVTEQTDQMFKHIQNPQVILKLIYIIFVS